MIVFHTPFAFEIRSRRGVWQFTGAVTTICLVYTLAATAGADWVERSSLTNLCLDLLVTAADSLILALPLAYYAARSNLALYQAKCAAERSSLTDPLTGLMNRRAFMRLAEKSDGGQQALVVFDIDRFKRINDAHGHQVGDVVIRHVAVELRMALRSMGKVARVGGEEFALLAPPSAYDDLLAKLTELRTRIEATPIAVEDGVVATTLSAGVALGAPGESFASLYRRADKALYAAKRAGRNCVRVSAGSAPAEPSEALKAALTA